MNGGFLPSDILTRQLTFAARDRRASLVSLEFSRDFCGLGGEIFSACPENMGISPSTSVGWVSIASRSAVYGNPASIATCTAPSTSPAPTPTCRVP